MKYTILSGNTPLYQALYENKGIEDEIDGDIDWVTPTSLEEMDRFAEELEGLGDYDA